MRKLMMTLTAALLILGPRLEAAATGGNGCVGLAFGSDQKQKGAWSESFSATEILDVDLSVLFNPGVVNRFATGEHSLEVRIYTPRGHLYQSVAVPFTSDARRGGQPQRLAGYPHPIPTQPLREVTFNRARYLAASARLPVGGTMISSSSLYGTWGAEVFIDGESLRCSQPAKFTITQ